jgi:hypothetical protein
LHKSDAGWKRLRERTNSGAFARGSVMDHTVQSAKPKPDVIVPKFEGETVKPNRRSARRRRVVAPNGRTF